jgi:hypothetical protein
MKKRGCFGVSLNSIEVVGVGNSRIRGHNIGFIPIYTVNPRYKQPLETATFACLYRNSLILDSLANQHWNYIFLYLKNIRISP